MIRRYIGVNQVYFVENYPELDYKDAAIIDFIWGFTNTRAAKKHRINFEGEDFFWIKHELFVENLPLLRINNERVYKKRLLNLCKKGLLIKHPNSRELNKSYYAITENVELIYYKEDGEGMSLKSAKGMSLKSAKGMSLKSANINKEKGIKEGIEKKGSSTTTNFPSKNFLKDTIIKYLENRVKNKDILEVIEEFDVTIPEIRKKFADYWIGLERGFDGEKDKRWVLNSFPKWLDQEIGEMAKVEAKNNPIKTMDDKVNEVRLLYNKFFPYMVEDTQLGKLQTRIIKLFKEGETLETIEQQFKKAKTIGAVWRDFNYSLVHFSQLKNIQI